MVSRMELMCQNTGTVQIGGRASVQQTLGDTVADKAEVVLGAGPMLVENGKPKCAFCQ